MKFITPVALAVIVLTSGFSGCENIASTPSGTALCGASINTAHKQESLAGKWHLKGYGNAGMALADCVPAGVSQMSLEFKGNGSLVGVSSCNSVSATYAAAGGKLQISGFSITEKLCGLPEGLIMMWEKRMVTAVQEATAYEFLGNSLHLKTSSGNDLFLIMTQE